MDTDSKKDLIQNLENVSETSDEIRTETFEISSSDPPADSSEISENSVNSEKDEKSDNDEKSDENSKRIMFLIVFKSNIVFFLESEDLEKPKEISKSELNIKLTDKLLRSIATWYHGILL